MVKNPRANAGDARDAGSIPGSGRSPGEGNGYMLQYFCLENPMDRGTWRATVHGVAKNHDLLGFWLFPKGRIRALRVVVEWETGILSWSPRIQHALTLLPWASHLPSWSFREPLCKTIVRTEASTDGGHDRVLYMHHSLWPRIDYTHSVYSYPILQRKLRQRYNNIQPSILFKTTSFVLSSKPTALLWGPF